MRTLPVLSPLHALTFFPHRQGMQRAILCVVTSSWLRHIARPPPADQPDRRPHQPLRPARVRTRPPADPPRAQGCPLRPRLPLIPPAGHGVRSPQWEQNRYVVRRVQRRLLPLEPRRCHRHEEDQLHPLPRPRRTRVAARGAYPPVALQTSRPTRDAETASELPPQWGGALELYPVLEADEKNPDRPNVPHAKPAASIPVSPGLCPRVDVVRPLDLTFRVPPSSPHSTRWSSSRSSPVTRSTLSRKSSSRATRKRAESARASASAAGSTSPSKGKRATRAAKASRPRVACSSS